MSKIKSKLVMPLQEIAEELGFSTIQDALDNGYHVVEDMVTGEATLKKLNEEELAHEAWLKEKNIIVSEIEMLINDTPYQVYKDTLRKAIKFIEGVKYEQ